MSPDPHTLPGCHECGGTVLHRSTCSAFDPARNITAAAGAPPRPAYGLLQIVPDPVEFVRARIAEDRADAERAGRVGTRFETTQWEYAEVYGAWRVRTVATFGSPGYEEHHSITHDQEGLSDSVDEDAAPHIVRHDPARVLAQCDVFERLLTVYNDGYPVRLLAALWADHPDYQQAWAQ